MSGPVPASDPDDAALFDAADRYVSLLQAGERQEAEALLQAHPQLAGLAGYLDVLDGFAEAANGSPSLTPFPGNDARTLSRAEASDRIDETLTVPFGRDFGRYELLEEVGRGGMGVVYRARQRDLNRTVALKMILSSQLACADDVKRFYREARAAGQLRHPHIVGIHEVGQVHGQHYFAMEYVAGRSLGQQLRVGPLAAEHAARLLSAVARAVEYLHTQGIVHRDLKPSNILLDEAGAPYVTDFGLAKIFQDDDDRTQSGVILGTPGYMAPEQAAGRISEISLRSDVYSLGAILYEMLCGRAPFREDNPLNTILQVLESEPTRPLHLNPRIPPELERICLRCLEKIPERRYSSAAALADELDRFLRHEPLETQPAGLADRLRRWVRRDMGLVARLAILAAAATIVEVQHLLSHRHWAYHIEIKLVFALWTVLAFFFQWLLRRPRTEELAKLAWAVTDPFLLMVVLSLAEDDIGPLMIGYPLILTASGLWFSVRLVVVSAIASAASFALLLYLRHEPTSQPHYPVIFATALAVIGWIVAFQVHRVRTLSRYFEQSQWPRDR
ncbi:MAG TPA: serine/threonine-protein kinase [Planctomycetaceae bacterium]|nr:serine/threonine-protein kinase [Planctomycetaceae bacterium]